MASVARSLLIFTNVTLLLIGAALLIVGLAALIKPDLEFAEWALNDESGRSHNEIIVFYIASGSCLVLVATVGFCGACHYQYGVLTAYLVLLCACTVAYVVYLAHQLTNCIKDRVCTKGFDVNSRRHWSILVQALAFFFLLANLALTTVVCCKAKVRRGYRAVPL